MATRRDVFQAIADPTRREILTLLAVGALTAGSIANNFKSSRQTISKHIQILTECKLLHQEPMGREIYYRLSPETMKEIADFIEPFRQIWEARFNQLNDLLLKMKNSNNEQ